MDDNLVNKKQSLIVEALTDAILSGAIPAGTELKQTELAETLGVSRMPVREVLLILEYLGLVKRLPNNHVQVTALTSVSFAEIFTMCADMEFRILEQGKRTASDEKDPWIENILQRLQHSDLQNFPSELMFHREISMQTDNLFLQKTLQTITEIYLKFALSRPEHNSAECAEILQRVLSSSGSEQKAALENYFSQLTEEMSDF